MEEFCRMGCVVCSGMIHVCTHLTKCASRKTHFTFQLRHYPLLAQIELMSVLYQKVILLTLIRVDGTVWVCLNPSG